jgi:hypothetical protein
MPTRAGAERFCESSGRGPWGIAVRLRRPAPGMTHNGSGALGCLGDELSAVVPGVDLAHRLAGLMSSLSNPWVVTRHRSAARCPPGRHDQADDREEPWR